MPSPTRTSNDRLLPQRADSNTLCTSLLVQREGIIMGFIGSTGTEVIKLCTAIQRDYLFAMKKRRRNPQRIFILYFPRPRIASMHEA
jgi:hypothetical protein